MARRFGQPFMPWQELVALVGGEIDPETGLPAFREVIVTVNRQSGKTTLVLGWQVQRCVGWRDLGPQRVAYSAQTGNDARKKLVEDQIPILTPHKTALGIRRFFKGMGNESVEFVNGSRVVLLASAEDSGHGKTIDLGVKDELFADHDDRRDQALVPAMITKPAAQILTASTMGTDASVPLNEAVARGRAAVDAGLRSGTAYFEWSAAPDADPDDPAVWWSCMPALGYTLTEDVVRHARRTLRLSEFRRAFLNTKDGRRGDPVIPDDKWGACLGPRMPSIGCLSLDVSPEGGWSAIGAACRVGDRLYVDVAVHGPGTGWVVDDLVRLNREHKPALIVCDPAGPAGSLLTDMEDAGLEIRTMNAREHAQACGALYADVMGDRPRLVHPGVPALNAAIDGADRRSLGDGAWLWDRKHSAVDISPLVAVTLARWAAAQPAKKRSLDPDNYR